MWNVYMGFTKLWRFAIIYIIFSTNGLPFFFSLFVDPELHNTCGLKKDVSDRIDKEGVTSGFITDECKGKRIRIEEKNDLWLRDSL